MSLADHRCGLGLPYTDLKSEFGSGKRYLDECFSHGQCPGLASLRESVQRLARGSVRQPKYPGLWATQLDLNGRPGARRPWRVFVQEPWSSESSRKKADYDKVLAWLRPRIAGFSSLSLVLDGDTWYLLSEVLTMSLHLLRPHFELKLESGNLSGHFSHTVNAAAQSTVSKQRCSTSSSKTNGCCHIAK